MSNLSEGQLHCSPIVVKCTLSLRDIVASLGDRRYTGDVPAKGWGSVSDDTSSLHLNTQERPIVSRPTVVRQNGDLPERLFARYYWDHADTRAVRLIGTEDPRRTHTLNAVDLILAQSSLEDDEYSGVFTTRAEKEIAGYIEKGFRDSFEEMDASSFVQLDAIDTAFSSDFYLWLLARYDGDQQLAPDLVLEVIRSMTAEDRLSRGTSLTAGAQMDRAELAAAVLGKPTKFGPAQFAVYDSSLDLSLEIELFVNGSFRVIVGSSDYGDSLPRAEKGRRLAEDTAFIVLPKLRRAYANDMDWPSPGLGQLRSRAKTVLEDHLEANTGAEEDPS